MVGPLRILTVCTANVCRSPMAESFLRAHALEHGLDATVESAGFLFDDEPATAVVVEVMAELGHELGGHRSRIVTAEMLVEADLVVTMERRHARDLTLLGNGTGRKVHTLVSLVEVLESGVGAAVADPRERVVAASEGREAAAFLGEGPDEVADPFGRSKRVNRQTAATLRDLSERLVTTLVRG